MKSSNVSLSIAVAVTVFIAITVQAGDLDLKDPRRAVAREDDIRIDAELRGDSLSAHTPVSVICQIQNLTGRPIGVADKVAEASYDQDTGTVTLSIGSEIPAGGAMPHVLVIEPGQKKTIDAAASLPAGAGFLRSGHPLPHSVEVRVNLLRDISLFAKLIEEQDRAPRAKIQLASDQFDRWIEGNDAIVLNSIPAHWDPSSSVAVASADN